MDPLSELPAIQAIVARVAELDSIDEDTDIYQAGISSMGSMDVMLDLETEFSITLIDEDFLKARTCRQLAELVRLTRGVG